MSFNVSGTFIAQAAQIASSVITKPKLDATTIQYWEVLSSQELAAGAAAITFSNIPTAYTMFRIEVNAIQSANGGIKMTFNDDGGANYNRQYLNAVGAAVSSNSSLNNTSFNMGSDWTGQGGAKINILNQLNLNKHIEGISWQGGGTLNSYSAGNWTGQPKITKIVLTADGVGEWSAKTTAILLGAI